VIFINIIDDGSVFEILLVFPVITGVFVIGDQIAPKQFLFEVINGFVLRYGI
jgi:hypothetical protein